ncbi:DinB family protein [Fulvivirgaceae bacterium BMA10]|uniref:DinB family protein n=1 Tax=Splendidivirga corallicola TaxID=3051826 RepID=A0ABT8KNI7_9BACT|nr:DinB family protein [Fulvivirgaceae bacterium BMA10]
MTRLSNLHFNAHIFGKLPIGFNPMVMLTTIHSWNTKMEEIIKYKLRNQYKEIELFVSDQDKNFLNTRHRADKWSIHENLAHLGRYQEIFLHRVHEILKGDNPAFGRYKAEMDEEFTIWESKNTSLIIEESKEKRKEIAEFILGLKDYQLTNTGTHPKLGQMNIPGWCHFFLLHESHHAYTIFWIVNEYRKTQ